MATELVFNMIANSSQFTAGMKQAQKAADSLIVGTMTNLERFQHELGNVQKLADLKLIDPEVTKRAQGVLVQRYDPFGLIAQGKLETQAAEEQAKEQMRLAKDKADYIAQVTLNASRSAWDHQSQFHQASIQQDAVRIRAAEEQAKEQMRLAKDKADYIAQVTLNANRSAWDHQNQFHQASIQQDAARMQAAKARTASIIASERAAAQASITHIQRVADFRERTAERSGRALLREAQISGLAGSAGIGGNRAMIIQQLAFAAEDAATQFGTRGFAGSLMAAGNNLTFAASMAHPAVGVFASLALTGTMVYQVYSRVAEETKRVAEENNRLEKVLARVKSGFQDYINFRNDLRSQSAFPEAVRADQRYIDEAESNNRQLAVLATKRTQIMRDANAQGEAYSSSLYKRLNPFEMVAEADRRLQAQKQMNDLIAEESRLKLQALTIQSRGEQVRVAELAKEKEKKDRDERSAQAEAWLDESARIADAEDKMALRQEMIEAKRKRIIEEKRTNNSRLLSGAMDIRSAEAYGVMANAQARSMLPGMGGASQQTPKATDVDREILKNAAKGAAVLEKLLHEFGRKPSIPIVGLN